MAFRAGNDERLAAALGWFSIGLGVVEVVAPRNFAKLIGVRDHSATIRMVGVREIATGVGILSQPRPVGWLWGRVAGDVMDLSLLSAARRSYRTRQDRVAAAMAAVIGVTALDLLCSGRMSRRPGAPLRRAVPAGAIRVTKAITINRPPEELYRRWRDLRNLPRLMSHLESVQVISENRSHWKTRALAGRTFEWDAEITEDRPNERISWRSLPGADVDNSGTVRFERAPGGRGTVVKVELQYRPPGGAIGATIAKLFGQEPGQQVQEDLRRFKQLMETGEVATTEGQPSGRKTGALRRLSVTRVLEGKLR